MKTARGILTFTRSALISGAILLFVAAGAVCAMRVARAQEPLTFKSSVDVVTIQALVRDSRGRVVKGLRTADFEVLDNGKPKPIIDVRADAKAPLSVAILLDLSGSMQAPSKREVAEEALGTVLGQLREGVDEAALYTFDSTLHEQQTFTSNLDLVKRNVKSLEAWGATSLYDALAATAQKISTRQTTRRAIIAFTDGLDTSSDLTAAEVSALASSIDVPVYVMATVPLVDRLTVDGKGRPTRTSDVDLGDLAEWTGGAFCFASTATEAVIMTAHYVNDLRQQYLIAIEAANVREWRRLDVRVRKRTLDVRARSGYFGG
jgi:VWFA-related protein